MFLFTLNEETYFKVLVSNLYTVGMWDKDLVNAPNLKVSWLWLVDPPQNQQACTFLRFVQYGESVQSLAFQKISELLNLSLTRANLGKG